MVDQLPTHGQFKAAMLNDDEYVSQFVNMDNDSDDDEKPVRVNLAGYDPVVAKLNDACDLLIALRSTLVAVNNQGKPPKNVKYMPRPKTAFDRIQARKRDVKLDKLRSVLLPGE